MKNQELIGKSDPYVRIQLTNKNKTPYLKRISSKAKKSDLNPTWNEDFVLFVLDPKDDCLFFQVMDKNVISDDKMGCATVPVASIPATDRKQETLTLEKTPKGTLLVEYSWQPFQ